MTESSTGSVTVNGVRLAFRHWPPPSRNSCPPVVLLHGGLQSGSGMKHLADQLALSGEVVVPDLRGRGESDRPEDGYGPATMADDVAAFIAALGMDRPVLIGRLHGGLVAYHVAARHPDATRGIVLGDVSPEVGEERAARTIARTRALPRSFATHDEAARFYEDVLGLPIARAHHDIPSDLETLADGTLRWRHDLDIVARIEAAAMPRADWDLLAQVRCPALVLRGQRGSLSEETAARMRAVMPRATVQTIIGSGYDVFLGPGAEQTVGAIQIFLRGLVSRESSTDYPPDQKTTQERLV
ncbi:MAG: alpha/beta hydrolase [Thermomicrobiales bacterium]